MQSFIVLASLVSELAGGQNDLSLSYKKHLSPLRVKDLVDRKHPHFRNNSNHNLKRSQVKLEKYFDGVNSAPDVCGKMKVLPQFQCEGFGKLIRMNCFNTNESKFVKEADSTSAWSPNCLKITKLPDKVCENCKSMMKSNNFRQKASIIRKSEGKNSKYKPYSCYPFATRGILRTQANIFKKTKKSLNCAKQTNRKLKSMLEHVNNKSFSTYVKDIAEKFRKDSGTGFTQVTYEALHDIPKNCHTVSQNGYRHSKLLQAFSVLTYNNSATCSELLHENLPILFCSPSLVLKRRMPKHSPFLTLPGILTDEALVKRHFERFGCSFKGNLGLYSLGKTLQE